MLFQAYGVRPSKRHGENIYIKIKLKLLLKVKAAAKF